MKIIEYSQICRILSNIFSQKIITNFCGYDVCHRLPGNVLSQYLDKDVDKNCT